MGFKFNPVSGTLDLVNDAVKNFSLETVASGEVEEIPSGQQMLFHNDLMVNGNLMVKGFMIQMRQPEPQATFWSKVPINKTLRVPRDRVMFYGENFMCLGNLRVEGDLLSVQQF